jgi:hypothetical protein
MDSLKIHHSEFPDRSTKSVFRFLDRQSKSRSADNVSVYTIDTDEDQPKPSRITPSFTFRFEGFSLGEHVEYDVVLLEQYKILGRPICNKYRFTTRYSMLEVLAEKLGTAGFPGKKFFGNKSPIFLERRKVELQDYLNRAAKAAKP